MQAMIILNSLISIFYKMKYIHYVKFTKKIYDKLSIKKSLTILAILLLAFIFFGIYTVFLVLFVLMFVFIEVAYAICIKGYIRKVQQTQRFILNEKGGAKRYFFDIPKRLQFEQRDLQRFLSDRASGSRTANIVKTTVQHTELYGPVLVHVVDNLFIRTPVKSLNDHGVSTFSIIPQKVSSLGNKAYYANDRLLYQSVDGVLGNISYSQFERQLLSDNLINQSFIEYREFEKEQQQKQFTAHKQQEDEVLYRTWIDSGISDQSISVLKKIHQNRDTWGFDKWNVDNNFIDNKEFMRSRMCLLNSQSLKNVEKKKSEIEAVLRKQVLFKQLSDRGSFELIVLFESDLKPYKKSANSIKSLNESDKLFIGNSLTGEMMVEWNQQANHIIVAGVSGSGKSVLLSGLIFQLTNLTQMFNYKMVYLTSSSKIADFIPFGEKGAILATGVEEQVKVFKEVKDILTKREALFAKNNVKNIYEYNNKFPEEKMSHIILLADEYENSLVANNKEFEPLMIEILNIARSSGATVLLGSQSILKSAVGTALDKMTVKFSGFNNKNVLNQLSPEVADYYRSLNRKPQGVFFFNALNLELKDQIFFGDSNYTLIQTPWITDIEEHINELRTTKELTKNEDNQFKIESLL